MAFMATPTAMAMMTVLNTNANNPWVATTRRITGLVTATSVVPNVVWMLLATYQ